MLPIKLYILLFLSLLLFLRTIQMGLLVILEVINNMDSNWTELAELIWYSGCDWITLLRWNLHLNFRIHPNFTNTLWEGRPGLSIHQFMLPSWNLHLSFWIHPNFTILLCWKDGLKDLYTSYYSEQFDSHCYMAGKETDKRVHASLLDTHCSRNYNPAPLVSRISFTYY